MLTSDNLSVNGVATVKCWKASVLLQWKRNPTIKSVRSEARKKVMKKAGYKQRDCSNNIAKDRHFASKKLESH